MTMMFVLVLAVSRWPTVVMVVVHVDDFLFHDHLLFHLYRFRFARLGCNRSAGRSPETAADDRALTPAHRRANRGACPAADCPADHGFTIDLARLSGSGPSSHYNCWQSLR
jgi:hypothetical protein